MTYPNELQAICPICGAKPGTRCYGNGTMPPGAHPNRLLKAYQNELENLRSKVNELSFKPETLREQEIAKELTVIKVLEEVRYGFLGQIEGTRSNFLPGPYSDLFCERLTVTTEVLNEHITTLKEDLGL